MDIKKILIIQWLQIILYLLLMSSSIRCLDIVSQYSYDEAWEALVNLQKNNKGIITLKTAEKSYGGDCRDGVFCGDDLFCGNKSCETPIVFLGVQQNTKKAQRKKNEILLVGSMHGDERQGTAALIGYLQLMCYLYNRNPLVTYLINTRDVWILPFANSWGYYHNRRRELLIDPNRDFPYMAEQNKCFRSRTARIINELFHEHRFELSLTLHSGTRVIGYSWGSPEHNNCTESNLYTNTESLGGHFCSTESPDYMSQRFIAKELAKAAGRLPKDHKLGKREELHYLRRLDDNVSNNNTVPYYVIGSMNEQVYPVLGGYEDWAYAGSWMSDKITDNCFNYYNYPKTFSAKHNISDSLRTSTFLVEMSYNKNTLQKENSTLSEIFFPSKNDGEIGRNIRLIIKATEFANPDLVHFVKPSFHKVNSTYTKLKNQFYAVGCEKIDFLSISIRTDNNCATCNDEMQLLSSPQSCQGLGLWEGWKYTKNQSMTLSSSHKPITSDVTLPILESAITIVFRYSFDHQWGSQNTPDPNVQPQSHLVRSRFYHHFLQMTISPINKTEDKVVLDKKLKYRIRICKLIAEKYIRKPDFKKCEEESTFVVTI